MKTFPKLYTKDGKGKVREFQVWADNGRVYTAHGLLGGKLILNEYAAEAKHVGMYAEIKAEQQAEIEALAIWKEKKRKRYTPSLGQVNKSPLRPMLAYEYKGEAPEKCLVQPKLDGIRCLAFNDLSKKEVETILLSRTGKHYDVPHLEHLVSLVALVSARNVVLDGEIYVHGKNLQEINSLVRKTDKEFTSKEDYYAYKEPLEFHVYDLIDMDNKTLPFSDRFHYLKKIVKEIQDNYPIGKSIKLVRTEPLTDVEKQIEQAESEGYEGIMLRDATSPYTIGKRSKNLLKYKRFQDDEFEVVGWKTGKGSFENVVIWRCKTKTGAEFDVTPKGTMEERAEFLDHADLFIGKMLTVKFMMYSPDGIPLYPVGKGFRDE